MWLANLVPIAATVGAVIGGFMASYGRRYTFILMDNLSIVSILVQLLAIYQQSFNIFAFGRVLAGLSAGVNSTLVPLYIKEMSPDALSEVNSRPT